MNQPVTTDTLDLIEAMRAGLFSPSQPPQQKEPEDIVVRSVEVLRLNPGDTLVYTHPHWFPPTQYEKVRDQLLKMIPDGVNLAILDGGARFQVIRKEEESTNVIDHR